MLTGKIKRISILAICILVMSFLIIGVFANTTSAGAYDIIKSTLTEVEKQIDEVKKLDGKNCTNSLPLGLSSNPYDYIANNSEYNRLVAMGLDAMNAIEKCLADENAYTGLKGYILAIAMEDIAKVDLKSFKAYNWQDSKSFLSSWKQLKINAVNEVPQVMSNASLSSQEKWAEIAKFGILAVEPLEAFRTQLRSSDNGKESNGESEKLASQMINLLTTSNKSTITGIARSDINPPD
ncbi:MAG: hypothetical protein VB118_00845 [Oscillospiraceae bacterium]|nr:hypothetical protein [Oscillospiraceae bacterium]